MLNLNLSKNKVEFYDQGRQHRLPPLPQHQVLSLYFEFWVLEFIRCHSELSVLIWKRKTHSFNFKLIRFAQAKRTNQYQCTHIVKKNLIFQKTNHYGNCSLKTSNEEKYQTSFVLSKQTFVKQHILRYFF